MVIYEFQNWYLNQLTWLYVVLLYDLELYVPILRCQVDCEYKLSRVFADHQEDFIEEHYNFLQYAYYQSNTLVYTFFTFSYPFYFHFCL